MDYSEQLPPRSLAAIVKVAWSLSVPPGSAEVVHSALPDGCIEIIARECGSSHWLRPQPSRFVVGLIDRPAELRFGGGSRFAGLRLWPWAWTWLSGSPLNLRNDWQDAADSALGDNQRQVLAQPSAGSWEPLQTLFRHCVDPLDHRFAQAALATDQTAAMAQQLSVSTRSCQRWFVRNAGITPRSFRRLRRFEQGLRALEGSAASLAEHAQLAGYADQAHMAREFRRYAKAPAQGLRGHMRGPFLAKT